MPNRRACHGRLSSLLLSFCFISVFLVGCQHLHIQPEPPPSPDATKPASIDITKLKNENQALRKVLAVSEKRIETLEQNLAGQKTQMLEKEAMISELRHRCDGQQKRLDAAIIDVVRAKAKLRSLESKAEAASTIAEAEIALKALKSRVAAADQAELAEIQAAEQLLHMSTEEFKARNFGGALYLASQTKNHVRAGHDRLSGNKESIPVEGETAFTQPLPLKVNDKSNLRAGPGLTFKILSQLEKGTLVIGYSFKDRWIRIGTQEGMAGWIFQDLVGAR